MASVLASFVIMLRLSAPSLSRQQQRRRGLLLSPLWCLLVPPFGLQFLLWNPSILLSRWRRRKIRKEQRTKEKREKDTKPYRRKSSKGKSVLKLGEHKRNPKPNLLNVRFCLHCDVTIWVWFRISFVCLMHSHVIHFSLFSLEPILCIRCSSLGLCLL